MNWWSVSDSIVAALLMPLTIWVLISGIDDLAIDIAGLIAQLRTRWRRRRPSGKALRGRPAKRVAIFVPCWHEHRVIGEMVERNNSRLLYSGHHFFIGVYPNDEKTASAVRGLSRQFKNVHLAMCPHPGPTSKADCLNWIYLNMRQHEALHDIQFDVVVTHDAEDVIHPESLLWINYFTDSNEMVQMPVLPLPLGVSALVHGVYCDEFVEFQARDMPARQHMGAFVPSNGVGAGFRRDALERLAERDGNRIFEPVCLTEDYENGLRLRNAGARQFFLPTQFDGIATREIFPKTFETAVRQRTRWVTGIALQTWQRHGWRGGLVQKYWLWRDRKGLLGNPASLLTNVLFVYGLMTWLGCLAAGVAWTLPGAVSEFQWALTAGLVVGIYRMVYRGVCVSQVFGWQFALLVPVRVVLANVINSCATARAIGTFTWSYIRGKPLAWAKTEHFYPSPVTLTTERRRLGEVLVGSGYILADQLADALANKPAGMRLGEYLLSTGLLDEESLYEALSLQENLPQRQVTPEAVPLQIARSLPAHVVREWHVFPIEVRAGRLILGSINAPADELKSILRGLTNLEIRFELVTPSDFRNLAERLL